MQHFPNTFHKVWSGMRAAYCASLFQIFWVSPPATRPVVTYSFPIQQRDFHKQHVQNYLRDVRDGRVGANELTWAIWGGAGGAGTGKTRLLHEILMDGGWAQEIFGEKLRSIYVNCNCSGIDTLMLQPVGTRVNWIILHSCGLAIDTPMKLLAALTITDTLKLARKQLGCKADSIIVMGVDEILQIGTEQEAQEAIRILASEYQRSRGLFIPLFSSLRKSLFELVYLKLSRPVKEITMDPIDLEILLTQSLPCNTHTGSSERVEDFLEKFGPGCRGLYFDTAGHPRSTFFLLAELWQRPPCHLSPSQLEVLQRAICTNSKFSVLTPAHSPVIYSSLFNDKKLPESWVEAGMVLLPAKNGTRRKIILPLLLRMWAQSNALSEHIRAALMQDDVLLRNNYPSAQDIIFHWTVARRCAAGEEWVKMNEMYTGAKIPMHLNKALVNYSGTNVISEAEMNNENPDFVSGLAQHNVFYPQKVSEEATWKHY
eukprot:TRINITY_DN3265_c0_g2_i3.p1 TRINITY_DN3265_c0_g2~~TRINITY_DN3265_c0_g2_i3.p1  ORF type:complete len:485 (+),score=59.31 TRINITY_DN3265_c0_g2_i3:34-1488(+)